MTDVEGTQLPCVSIEADLAALSEGFCPACHGRLEPHNRHVRCTRCARCMENLTSVWGGEPVYSTWSDCAYAPSPTALRGEPQEGR